jgi:hypothetical protein
MRGSVWRVVAASVQGSSHADAGLPCQDAHLYRVLPAGRLVMALADGAGSAARAAEAAQLAVRVAVDMLAQAATGPAPADAAAWQQAVQDSFAAARSALEAAARAAGLPLREFSTTLSCVVVAAPWLVVAQLGDGAVVYEDAHGELLLAARPQRGQYANEAYFLTMDGALEALALRACRQPVHALAATTDGLLRVALRLPGYEPHTPFFRPLLSFAGESWDGAAAQRELVRFLDSRRLRERSDDDKTLMLAIRVPAPAPGDARNLLPAARLKEARPL